MRAEIDRSLVAGLDWSGSHGAMPAELDGPVIAIGTRKGAFLLAADAERRRWAIGEPMFLGHVIHHLVADPRRPSTLLAATRTGHLGPTVLRSDDLGSSWAEATVPPQFRPDDAHGRTLNKVFWLSPGALDEPDSWYVGGSPQGLFRSTDDGATPGRRSTAGTTIRCGAPGPSGPTWRALRTDRCCTRSPSTRVDPAHLYIGLSGGGVFESTDRGADWRPLNAGCAADLPPDPRNPSTDTTRTASGCIRPIPNRLYQQNHCGIYRLDRPGERWTRIGDNMPAEIGDIGFPIELHPRRPRHGLGVPDGRHRRLAADQPGWPTGCVRHP